MIHAGKLIILSAPSGAGKTTLCARLQTEFRNKVVLSISCTTRAPRANEVEGVHYFFLTKDEFERRIQRDEFAEWAQVHGSYYGTLKKTVEHTLKRGKSVLLDIDVQGAHSLRVAFPGQTVGIFVSPPDLKTLEERLRGRGTDSEETIQKRIRNAKAEIERSSEFDLVLINDDLEGAYRRLKDYLIRSNALPGVKR